MKDDRFFPSFVSMFIGICFFIPRTQIALDLPFRLFKPEPNALEYDALAQKTLRRPMNLEDAGNC